MIAQSERLRSGIPEFGKMLSGGYMRTDAVLVAGSAGTGKSTIGMHYLVQGVADGEPGIYLTFEELPNQLYRDALSFGWDLRKLENEGKLRVVCTSPDVLVEEKGLEAILSDTIQEIKPKRIVVDSLSHFGMFVKPQQLRLNVYRSVMYFKTKNLSSILIWESPQVAGQSFAVSDEGVSFLTDSIILLKLIEIDSALRRGIVIVKMRGSQHDQRLREYRVTSTGIKILDSFQDYEGLMGGIPTKSSTEKFAELFGKAAKRKT